ncbi:unnamed protein product, partial [Bacillus phage SPG24]
KQGSDFIMTNTNIQWAVNILEDNMEGMSKEEKINYLEDVTSYGCVFWLC